MFFLIILNVSDVSYIQDLKVFFRYSSNYVYTLFMCHSNIFQYQIPDFKIETSIHYFFHVIIPKRLASTISNLQ